MQKGISSIILLFTLVIIIAALFGAYILGKQTATGNQNSMLKPTIVQSITPVITVQPTAESVSPTMAPTSIPTPSDPNVKVYSSPLGVSFRYLEKQKDWTIQVLEKGNKICLTYDANDTKCEKGQYVEVWEKQPAQTLQAAIEAKFLKGYAAKDCFVQPAKPYGNSVTFPVSYEIEQIHYPPSNNPDDPGWLNAEKCPSPYTGSNGIVYFIADKNHPSLFAFVAIGQYGIDADQKRTWDTTLIFTK